MDPFKIRALDNVNTEVCEQVFNGVNQHRNCKAMNESNYFLFWLYNFDLHNLNIEQLASCAPDPRSSYRWDNIDVTDVDLTDLQLTDTIEEELANLAITQFTCDVCGAGFNYKGYLDAHMNQKHGGHLFNPAYCDVCDKILSSAQRRATHFIKVHLTCKHCKYVSETIVKCKMHSIQCKINKQHVQVPKVPKVPKVPTICRDCDTEYNTELNEHKTKCVPDCKTCKYCKDKVTNGGSGKLQQVCFNKNTTCLNCTPAIDCKEVGLLRLHERQAHNGGDCDECKFCLDKVNNGGTGTLKRKCILKQTPKVVKSMVVKSAVSK